MQTTRMVRSSKPVLAFVVAATMVVSGFFVPNVRAASTWIVDGTGTCTDPDFHCTTIQAAVTAATDGDTIEVAAGTYTEHVNVNKSLTLLGAQDGVDARTRPGTGETIVNGPGGSFTLAANNIVLDGFTVQDTILELPSGTGIKLSSAFSGYQILNNIIKNNIFGLYLHSSGTTQTVVRHNLIQANNNVGPANGNGIYSDQGAENILVDENKFTGNSGTSINFAAATSNITISDNEMVNDGAIYLEGASNVTISGNTVNGSNNHGIQLAGSDTNINITDNSITGIIDGWSAIRVSGSSNGVVNITGNTLNGNHTDPGSIWAAFDTYGINVTDPAATVEVHLNNLADNDIALQNDGGAPVDAERNWWGHASGPESTVYPGGTGSVVIGDVNFIPWCTDVTCTTFRGPANVTFTTPKIGTGSELPPSLNENLPTGSTARYGVLVNYAGPAIPPSGDDDPLFYWKLTINGPASFGVQELGWDDEPPFDGTSATESNEGYSFVNAGSNTFVASGSLFGLDENDIFENYDQVSVGNTLGEYQLHRTLMHNNETPADASDDYPFSNTFTQAIDVIPNTGSGGGGGGSGSTPTPTPVPGTTPTPSPTTSPTPTTTPQVAGAADVNIGALGLSEGNVISAGIDAYIVNQFGYKRLLLNPIIFGFYGHLGGFVNVKNVVTSILNSLTTSNLYRNCEAGTPQVYALEVTGEDSGVLHWVNMSAEQVLGGDANFFKKVFCINNNEFNWYPKGADYTSLSQIPLFSR
jgi:parallel beta-helix repeat protein